MYLSRHFESVKLRLAIGDEFHQIDFRKMYTISWFVSTCICFYDEAQHIAYFRYGDQLAYEAKNDDVAVEAWNWQRSVTGGSSLSFCAACTPDLRVTLPYCWRFSSPLTSFLNETSGQYCKAGCNILSPLDEPGAFSTTGLQRIPQTQIRFVHYTNSWVYRSIERGVLLPGAVRMAQRVQAKSAEGTTREDVGASVDVFINLVHEGLSFLYALSQNLLFWNADGVVASFSNTEPQLLTIVYLHVVRSAFEEYKCACVGYEGGIKVFGFEPGHRL